MFKKLNDAISWIESQLKFKPKTDLDRIENAIEQLGFDFNKTKLVHIAGTNGKGSVSAYLTEMALKSHLKVGTYTSPYLIVFNERIRLNGEMIEDDALLKQINWVYDFNLTFNQSYGEALSFFELITLIALNYYHENDVDLILMEVGLGGLLDATNALTYDLSLITNIGFDHMKQLGHTLESIASNKLGILKEKGYLISTVDEALYAMFQADAVSKDAHFRWIDSKAIEIKSHHPILFDYQGSTFELSMLGQHQVKNAILAYEAFLTLYPDTDIKMIKSALYETKWAGRLEMIEPNIYIDGAHNTHALAALADTLNETFKDQAIHVLFSALKDKDIEGMLGIIKTFSKDITLTGFDDFRFESLASYEDKDTLYIPSFKDALAHIKTQMETNDVILITGSLHFIGYVKKSL